MKTATRSGPAGPAEARAHDRRWAAMAVLLMASFMNMIDVTIVNVALPSMRADLGATESGIEWVVAGYILSFALGLLPFGRYGDIIGKKRMFMLGVGGFTLASAFCGLASNIEMLIVARIIQGVGGAVMTPQVLAIAQVMFPPKERAMAFSLFGLTAGLASVAGPVAGGSLIHADFFGLGWRPIFLINLPIGALALWAGWKIIPTIPGNSGLRNDWGGIALAGGAILCLIFPLIEGRGFGWPAWIFVVMALALPLAAAFVWWERRQNARAAAELVPLGLLGNRNFIAASLGAMVFFSALPGFFFILAVFLQSGYGLDPLASGVTTIPFPVGVLVASVISGRSGGKFARSRIILGALSLIAAMALLRQSVSGLGDTLDQMRFILPLALGGLGTGLAISPLFQTALAGVPPKDAGSGSGALQSIQQIGGAFGVAIISQIFFATLGGSLAGGAVQHAAYREALSTAVLYNIACYAVVALLALLLKPAPLGRHAGPVAVE
ncbi:EmrB/QacA subfamily drug resistance transporter [Rhizobium sp. SG_E_25_P2]|uniref:MFS transporter n=1 Tax=Rhizobium sp. SG_E_25_P2 TaxID=2879942 RepID=UPI002476DFFF|nr:MFS transporter [Rhizobium sp. SG_E_25_P2]MDH6264965.1 EmrB/QacA subfamily drug resistance transporter [Rhizobium sp. SG_E_25_P2]